MKCGFIAVEEGSQMFNGGLNMLQGNKNLFNMLHIDKNHFNMYQDHRNHLKIL